jgi:hypothetical protein
MTTKLNLKSVAVITLLILVAASTSCMAADMKIEKVRMGKAYISSSNVKVENGDLVIRGVLRRNDRVGYPIATHVDAAVVSADGSVVGEGRSADVKVSRRIIGRGYKSYERFEVRIPGAADKGSVVRLTSHAGGH